jgi:hypothetical protein
MLCLCRHLLSARVGLCRKHTSLCEHVYGVHFQPLPSFLGKSAWCRVTQCSAASYLASAAVQLNDGLADKPAESLDYSLKQEQDRLLVAGQRIAKCMAR